MPSPQVLIVGAGPTGLVLALCLARQAVAFRIIDKNPGPGLASRAMAVQARTLELYDQLGIADEVVGLGIRMDTIHLRENGVELARVHFADLGGDLSPYPFALCFPQDDHEHFLVGKLRSLGIEVEWNVDLKTLEQDARDVRVVLLRAGMDEEVLRVAYVCGCDGAHSRVRQELDLGFPGDTYAQPFYVADVQATGAAADDLFVSVDANMLALMLPVRSSGMKRFIGTVPLALAERTDLTFADIQPVAEALLGVRVTQVNWFSTYRVHHRVASRFQVGRVFIAGDAGHLHSPAGGQGMNTGIGDAVNLAWKLAQVVKGEAPAAMLDSYEPERIAFARKLVGTTDRAFQSIVGRSWTGQFLRTMLLPLIAPVATDFVAVRRMMFRTVSQIRINYRESALSAGAAGDVHGGDRLPWVAFEGGGNFASLRARVWRLQVYGEPTQALTSAAARLHLPLDAFVWGEAARAAGLARDAVYLVRPDGHIAWAAAEQDTRRLEAFVARVGLRLPPAP